MKGRYTLYADNYAQLIDAPFELADQTRFSFEANGIPHEFVVSGQTYNECATYAARH